MIVNRKRDTCIIVIPNKQAFWANESPLKPVKWERGDRCIMLLKAR